MKQIILTLLIALFGFQGVSAQDDFYAPGKRVGLMLGFGVMDGISIDGTVSLSKWCTGRLGVDIMPGVSMNYDDSYRINNNLTPQANAFLQSQGITIPNSADVNIKGSVGRTQVHVLFDCYPFPNKSNFFVTAGFYFSGKKVIKLDGHTTKDLVAARNALKNSSYKDEISKLGIDIADYDVPFNDNGDIEAGVSVNGFRPYLGFGFGRAIPKHRVGCRVELGVQFHGKAKLIDSDNNDMLEAVGNFNSKDDLKDIMDKVTVLPVLKVSICGRIL